MARAGDLIRLAIVDRDSGFRELLAARVRARRWESHALERPPSADELVALRLHALVIDLALLRGDAWDYLDAIHAALPSLHLIVCTGRSSVAERVRGLRLGADDWVTKPFHPEELIARVEACVRRARPAAFAADASPALERGELRIRPDLFQAFAGERSLDLTRREFEMLHLLAEHPGQVLEREAIYERVWGYAMARGDRSVDVFVRKLRAKLERGSPGWRYIHTHFGVGYRFDARRAEGAEDAVAVGAAAASSAPRRTAR